MSGQVHSPSAEERRQPPLGLPSQRAEEEEWHAELLEEMRTGGRSMTYVTPIELAAKYGQPESAIRALARRLGVRGHRKGDFSTAEDIRRHNAIAEGLDPQMKTTSGATRVNEWFWGYGTVRVTAPPVFEPGGAFEVADGKLQASTRYGAIHGGRTIYGNRCFRTIVRISSSRRIELVAYAEAADRLVDARLQSGSVLAVRDAHMHDDNLRWQLHIGPGSVVDHLGQIRAPLVRPLLSELPDNDGNGATGGANE